MRLSAVLLSCVLVSTCLLAQTRQPPRAIAVRPASQQSASLEARVALVIGNGAYADAPLRNPVNDARAMKAALESCKFEVVLLTDASKRAMENGIRDFGDRIRNGAVGLFYFAGHGVQVRGVNYLVPVGANLEREDEVTYQAVEAGQVLDKMDSAKNRLNIMILDACRNNPFSRSWRSAGDKGLAQVNAPTGSFIAFATAPGREAADGAAEHGLYTQALLAELREPGVELEKVFKKARERVMAASEGRQTPWESNSTVGDFYFVPPQKSDVQAEEVTQSIQARGSLGPPPQAMALLGGLQVVVNAPGSKVSIDGKIRGQASPTQALNLSDLPVGEVQVKVEAPGYIPKEQPFSIQEGQWIQARLVLTKQAGGGFAGSLAPVTTRVATPINTAKPAPVPVAATASPAGQFQNKYGMVFAPIPAGSFTMGDDTGNADETPAHMVKISRPFAMQTTHVTVKQWKAFTKATGYITETERNGGILVDNRYSQDGHTGNSTDFKRLDLSWKDPGWFRQEDNHPVVCISWLDAKTFTNWLNKDDPGRDYRLPTEAEWEYACKAGTQEVRPGEVAESAWYVENSRKSTHPVGEKSQNPWGLFDMLGNACQWCQDWYGRDYYARSPEIDPQGPSLGNEHVTRGSDWSFPASQTRSTSRNWDYKLHDVRNTGFRLVMNVQ